MSDRARLVSVDEREHVAMCEDLRSGEQMSICYDTLVGADGASSKVRHLRSGQKQRIAVSLQGTVGLTGSDLVFEYRPIVKGYCWYVPTDVDAKVGCMLYEESATQCRAWIEAFCEELGIGVPKLRGAPIPTGEDVLLRAGTDVWLIGDAAGLASSVDGGGILYAIRSAHDLAASLCGGTPYEETMRPVVESLTQMAVGRGRSYFRNALHISTRGHIR